MKSLILLVLATGLCFSCNGVKRSVATPSYSLYYLGERDEAKADIVDETFIKGYKILKSTPLQDSDVKTLRTALNNAREEGDIIKKCPFEPVYALTSKDTLVLLFDIEYCPRMEEIGAVGNRQYELKNDPRVKKVIEKLFK
ncbi:hypothetical protein ACFSQW_09035 [Sphingobacterium tabacisoli]|uniref:DUF4476 domain-containing protein n=2 Tax=Sphingobacterium tabacisoli TaxID=2044855 RepID=A0ABW5L2P4_9SPHI